MKIRNLFKGCISPVNLLLLTAIILNGAKELWQTEILIFLVLIFIYLKFSNTGGAKFISVSRIYFWCAAVLTVFFVLSLTHSLDLSKSVENSYRFVLFCLFVFYLMHFCDESSFAGIYNFVVLLAFINSLYIIAQYNVPTVGISHGFLKGNPNYSALLNNVALIVISAVKTGGSSKCFLSKETVYRLPVSFIIIYASILLNSRTFYLSLAVFIFVLIYIRLNMRSALLFLLMCVIMFNFLPVNITKIGAQSYGRWIIWITALRALCFSPVFGVGVWNFGYVYEMNKLPDYFCELTYSHGGNFAHNDFLQLGVELGVIFMVIFLWVVVKLSILLIKEIKAFGLDCPGKNDVKMLVSSGWILTCFIYMMFNFTIYHTTLLLLLAVPLAYVGMERCKGVFRFEKKVFIIPVAVILNIPALFIISADVFAKYERFDISKRLNPYDSVNISKMIKNNPSTMLDLENNVYYANVSKKAAPYDKHIRITAAKAYVMLDDALVGEGKKGCSNKAVQILKENMLLFPTDCMSPNILGKIYFKSGSYLKALKMFNYSADRETHYFDSVLFSALCFAGMEMYGKAFDVLERLKAEHEKFKGFKPRSGYESIITVYDEYLVDGYMEIFLKER